MGRWYPSPRPTSGSGERPELSREVRGVRGRAPAENKFGAFLFVIEPFCRKKNQMYALIDNYFLT